MRKLKPIDRHHPRVGRIVIVMALGAIAAFAAAWAVREPGPVRRHGLDAQRPADRLQIMLLHCQRLGDAALNVPSCRAAWTESRDRFLGIRQGPQS